MKISQSQLQKAVEHDILTAAQARQLTDFLAAQPGTGPSFDFTHVLYYLGGLIAIGAMTLFMTLGWESFGGLGIFFISLLYAGVGLKLTQRFQQRGYAVPAGICATFVVALTPLAVYGLQQGLGFWPVSDSYRDFHRYIEWQWLYMELATLMVAAAMVWRYRYPFLLMPAAVTLWYLSMDIAAMLYGGWPGFELKALVSLYFGLVIILLGLWVDIRSRSEADYAFWFYLFGVLAFWCGLSLQHSDSEWSKLGYCAINVLLILTGVMLMRRVFVVFGALGVVGYLGYLSYDVFEDSLLFPFVLTLLGLAVIYLGVLWQKNEARISQALRQMLPIPLQRYLS